LPVHLMHLHVIHNLLHQAVILDILFKMVLALNVELVLLLVLQIVLPKLVKMDTFSLLPLTHVVPVLEPQDQLLLH